ncbi:MAG: MotE family protein [Hyphomicrobiaceae bacterium]|nr:MotE family protein [Hyphomicrobiaceae bacterium]
MRRTLTGCLLLAALAAPAIAQQGWAPTVTPIEASTEALPRMRGVQRALPGEDAGRLPSDSAGPSFLPLPLVDQRRLAVETAQKPAEPAPARKDAQPAPPVETPLAKGYCANVGTLASDAKFAWQKKAIADLATELDDRIAKLEAKTEEYKAWLARRDDFARRVTDNLVVIYSRMRSEAAGQQLMAMDEETAAAVIMKLTPKVASAILNDMNPQHAARLTSIISGAARTSTQPSGAQKPQPGATGPVPVPAPENKRS